MAENIKYHPKVQEILDQASRQVAALTKSKGVTLKPRPLEEVLKTLGEGFKPKEEGAMTGEKEEKPKTNGSAPTTKGTAPTPTNGAQQAAVETTSTGADATSNGNGGGIPINDPFTPEWHAKQKERLRTRLTDIPAENEFFEEGDGIGKRPDASEKDGEDRKPGIFTRLFRRNK